MGLNSSLLQSSAEILLRNNTCKLLAISLSLMEQKVLICENLFLPCLQPDSNA